MFTTPTTSLMKMSIKIRTKNKILIINIIQQTPIFFTETYLLVFKKCIMSIFIELIFTERFACFRATKRKMSSIRA